MTFVLVFVIIVLMFPLALEIIRNPADNILARCLRELKQFATEWHPVRIDQYFRLFLDHKRPARWEALRVAEYTVVIVLVAGVFWLAVQKMNIGSAIAEWLGQNRAP